MATKYYCKHCGQSFLSVESLTRNTCLRHPDGPGKRHELYEGSEKSSYICKYCGQKFSTIASLTTNKCPRHPNGTLKGRHSPAL